MGDQERVYRSADMTLNFRGGRGQVNGESLRLTLTEYQLLYHLVDIPGSSVSGETLIDEIWGEEYRDGPHYLTSSITRLNETLQDHPYTQGLALQDKLEGYLLLAAKDSVG